MPSFSSCITYINDIREGYITNILTCKRDISSVMRAVGGIGSIEKWRKNAV